MNPEMPEWLTITQASHYLNLSVGFLRKLVSARTIPFTRVGAKALRFRRSDLDAWMATNTSTAPSNADSAERTKAEE
jgi:excisionase family DNA binding protein